MRILQTVNSIVLICIAAIVLWIQLRPLVRTSVRASDTVNPGNQNLASEKQTQDESDQEKARTSDVVIVGAGISGLSAALDLGRGGAKVTVIDMSSVFGGHAVMSQGGVCIVGTPLQENAGIKDSPNLAYQDFVKWGEDAHVGWVRYYVDHSRHEIYDWLDELGVKFDAELGTAPGNSVDRFHQPSGRGIGLVTPIYRQCLEYPNIRFVWNTKAERLLTENEKVVGIATLDTRTKTETSFRAKSVILATGGFQSNLDMVREFWPAEFRFPQRILVGSGRNSVGSGHKMAHQVGADLVKMDYQWNYFTGIPDPRYPDTNRGLSAANMWGIIVNPDGRRFANLHNWAKEVMPPLLRQERATLWFIFDEAIKTEFTISGTDWADFKKVDREILRKPNLVKTANTIEELAKKAGLPPKNLVATVQRYNMLVDQGKDKDFARFGPGRPKFSNQASPKLTTPPFFAMQAFPLTRKSMGGVAIDRNCRVLDKKKKPIHGLFAVGELTGLAGINGKAALEGTFLGPCILTGRVAARSILNQSPAPKVELAKQSNSCISCHEIELLIAKQRPGFWHFAKAHQVALERGTDCRHCHAELAPYHEDNHRINPQVLATSCVECHITQE